MRLGLRLLFVFFLLNGIAAFFVLRVFSNEIKPSSREVMEDMMIDTAHVLAELAHTPDFSQHVDRYAKRTVDASIWGVRKESLDYRVYVTNDKGIVVYDSDGFAVGQDYSQWRDVARTLRGEYGARSTREIAGDDTSSVMHVAAPIYSDKDHQRITGVLTVAKPISTIQSFIDRSERKILINGLWWLLLSAAVGVVVTLWVVWQVRRLRDYALNVQLDASQSGAEITPPKAPGELGDLAKAMQSMRRQLDGREYVQGYVRALTHELKTPIAAIKANAELMQDAPTDSASSAASAECLAAIGEQTERMTQMVSKMLELSRLEQGVGKEHFVSSSLGETLAPVLARFAQEGARKNIQLNVLPLIEMSASNTSQAIQHDPELIRLAVSNVLDNAISFMPNREVSSGVIAVTIHAREIIIADNGVGVDAFAFARLGERFFSTARPNGLRSGSGLGLAICRQIMRLHSGSIQFERVQPCGLCVRLVF
jgi:two-component system, OmpR family, sensor histidine kinase CreC